MRRSNQTSARPAPEFAGNLTRAEYRRLLAAQAAEQAHTEPSPAVGAEPGASFRAEQCELDDFERAARLFCFASAAASAASTSVSSAAPDATGDADAAASLHADSASAPASPSHIAPRRPRRVRIVAQRLAAASFSIGVMTVVGLLAVGTTTPAEAVASANVGAGQVVVAEKKTTKNESQDVQAFVASGTDAVASLDRSDSYEVASMADIAAESGVTEFAGTWVNDSSANIQWPFPVGVPISAAYGSNTYLSQFSRPHRGVDLTPGAGADIHVIAAGTVRVATEAGGDYGVTVIVDHIIDGQLVSTRYAHMQRGSLKVQVGETVTAGQVVGKVGQTGKATGPHLHFEVLLGGSTFTDPMPWMYAHTTGTHTVG